MRDFRISLRIVFYREDDQWVAHCLEFDLLGHGETKREAMEGLTESIRLQIEESVRHDNPSNLFSPAGGELFEMFSAGTEFDERVIELELLSLSKSPIVIESVQARECAGDLAPSTISL